MNTNKPTKDTENHNSDSIPTEVREAIAKCEQSLWTEYCGTEVGRRSKEMNVERIVAAIAPLWPRPAQVNEAIHTPGPWSHWGDGFGDYAVEGADSSTICHVTSRKRADICLIAASPDLLRACEESAARIRSLCVTVNNLSGKLGLGKKVNAEDWDDIARAAISKARGV